MKKDFDGIAYDMELSFSFGDSFESDDVWDSVSDGGGGGGGMAKVLHYEKAVKYVKEEEEEEEGELYMEMAGEGDLRYSSGSNSESDEDIGLSVSFSLYHLFFSASHM